MIRPRQVFWDKLPRCEKRCVERDTINLATIWSTYGIEFIACQPFENLVKRNTRHEDILVSQSAIYKDSRPNGKRKGLG